MYWGEVNWSTNSTALLIGIALWRFYYNKHGWEEKRIRSIYNGVSNKIAKWRLKDIVVKEYDDEIS